MSQVSGGGGKFGVINDDLDLPVNLRESLRERSRDRFRRIEARKGGAKYSGVQFRAALAELGVLAVKNYSRPSSVVVISNRQ